MGIVRDFDRTELMGGGQVVLGKKEGDVWLHTRRLIWFSWGHVCFIVFRVLVYLLIPVFSYRK